MMRLRSILVVAFAVSFFAFQPVAATQLNTGAVVMDVTANASAVTINVTINDTGAVPGCPAYIIVRAPYSGAPGTVVGFAPRQFGTTNVLSFIDTNVLPGQLYWYDLRINLFPVPFEIGGCDQAQFRLAHGSSWGLDLSVPAYTGTTPAPLYKGLLVYIEGHTPPAYMELCNGGQAYFSEFHPLPPGSEQYFGKIVTAYIDWSGWNVQFGWSFYPTGFEQTTCGPVATDNVTWGHVKSLYR